MPLQIDDLRISTPSGKRLFDIESAEFDLGLTAVVGPNGAGKSTWLRTLVGLAPLNGSIRLNGIDARSERRAFLSQLAYQPQNFAAYPEMNGAEFLTYFLRLRGVGVRAARACVAEWLEVVGLAGRQERCGAYSQGMLQRLGLAYALQSQAALCVLDEPFAGVDPGAREQLSDVLAEAARHRIILICTHHVEEMIERGARIATIRNDVFTLERS